MLKPYTSTRFDWLTVRFTRISDIAKLMRSIGLVGFTWNPLGHSYDTFPQAKVVHISGANSNVITIAWKEAPIILTYEDDNSHQHSYQVKDYEVLINWTGTGLDLFRKMLNNHGSSLSQAIRRMYINRGNFTRVDLAHDFHNFDKHYSGKYLAQQAYRGNLVSSARYCKWLTSFSAKGGNSKDYNGTHEGTTLYIGKSPKQLRVYNKLAEEHPMNVTSQGVAQFEHGSCLSWQRWELQLNHQYAQDLIRQWVKNKFDALQTWTDVISSSYKFITRKGQTKSKRSQYPVASWFKKVIATGHKFEQTPEAKPAQTLAHAHKWMKHQVYGVLGNVAQAHIEKIKQDCGSYTKAVHIEARLFFHNLLQFLTDTCKNDNSLIDTYLSEMKHSPLYTTDLRSFNTKGVLD